MNRAQLSAGDRVRVTIVDKTIYAQGAGDALDGCEGVIERFKTDGEALVKFDKPAPTWWSNQLPWGAGWFPPCDLTQLEPSTLCECCDADPCIHADEIPGEP